MTSTISSTYKLHHCIPDVYINDPAFTSLFQPSIHKGSKIADHAAVQCQLELYGLDRVGVKIGNMNAHAGNFTALCAPNCLPDRLAIVAYAMEYAFCRGDDSDDAPGEYSALNDSGVLVQRLTQGGSSPVYSKPSEPARRKADVQAKIAAEFLRLDRVFGFWFLSRWEDFLQSTEDIRVPSFSHLDEYLISRAGVVAPVISLLRWGTGIYLTPDEESIASSMSYAGHAHLTLTADLFSWERELNSHLESNGRILLDNAVHVLMVSQILSESSAKEVVRNEIRALEERFLQLKGQYEATTEPVESIIRWLNLLKDIMVGNFVWSLRTTRYSCPGPNPYQDHLKAFDYDDIHIVRSPAQTAVPILEADPNQPNYLDPVLDAYSYINSLPSKNVRLRLILALDSWYKVPEKSLLIIEGVINFLHCSSLLLDDIQDDSSLRRGKPVAHQIFGTAQTINTATYLINEALCLVQMLSPSAVSVYSGTPNPSYSPGECSTLTLAEEMRNLHLGQSYDLHWSHHSQKPTPEEYFNMVDGKTGGLFRLICRLMKSEAMHNRDLNLDHFATLLGRYFQIRDDYQNLLSAKKKGFCEDFNKGKLSFPVILAMRSKEFATIFSSIFNGHHSPENLSLELKQYLLDRIADGEAFPQTKSVLNKLHLEVLNLLGDIERSIGIDNWPLRMLILKLRISDGAEKQASQCDASWEISQRRLWEGVSKNSPVEPKSTSRQLPKNGERSFDEG
ncbi:unnamed protein product [Penicillium salamii]|nr:unnamed protein product [Penicillium salamii]